MTITTADQKDLATILELQKECYQSEAELYQDDQIPPLLQDLADLEASLQQGTLLLKAEINESIVGSVRATFKEGNCYIGRLIVRPGFQNQKIGQRLIAKIEASFPNTNRFELFTGHKSEKNLYLYKKLGYQVFKEQIVNERLRLVFLEKYPIIERLYQ